LPGWEVRALLAACGSNVRVRHGRGDLLLAVRCKRRVRPKRDRRGGETRSPKPWRGGEAYERSGES